jgi:tripartite-type tricarboxylate transporter receptor subunit TctC
VPSPPGGSVDTYARLLQTPLEAACGARVRILNEPGASGLLGANKVKHAPGDGATLGLLQSVVLLGAQSDSNVVRLLDDYWILGRVGMSRSVLVTHPRKGPRTVEELLAAKKSWLFGVTGSAGNSLTQMAVCASLLGLDVRYLPGLNGSREHLMALLRGDVDLIANNYDSLREQIESGEVRPLLQFVATPLAGESLLQSVDCLGGEDGWAARRAALTRRTVARAVEEAARLSSIAAAGMIVVAPRSLSDANAACWRAAVWKALQAKEFALAALKARRSVAALPGVAAEDAVRSATIAMDSFGEIVRAARERVL